MMTRWMLSAAVGAVVLMCSACGGGGGSTPDAIASPVQKKTVLIEMYGDSTTVGCSVQADAAVTDSCLSGYVVSAHNEPATIQYLLRKQFGTAVSIANLGVKGTTLADLLNGTNGIAQPWPARMAASKAQIVTVNDGLNDAYVAGLTPADFSAQLNQAISVAKAAGKTIVLETSNPMSVASNHNPTLSALVAAELETANKWGISAIDQFGHLSSDAGWPEMLSDNVHPTDAGYELKGQYAAAALSPTVAWYLNH